jgi:hypothetical protein
MALRQWACIAARLESLPTTIVTPQRDGSPFLQFLSANSARFCNRLKVIESRRKTLAEEIPDWIRDLMLRRQYATSDPEQRATGALQVFSMLAAVMAPGLMCCPDARDQWSAFGTAGSPSQIAHAVYSRIARVWCRPRVSTAKC